MEKIRTIKLGGSLGRKFGRTHRLAVANTAEAVRALCATRPGFEKHMMESKDKGIVYTVFNGRENIGEDDLQNPIGDNIIRIIPLLAGSKKGGVLQIIVGAVLIVAGALIQTFVFGGAPNPFSNYLYGAGISMIVGGVVQMLTPVPKAPDRTDDQRKSYVFNGAVNVQAQGSPVPLLYGELIVGSVVVSAGISVDDNYIASQPPGDRVGGSGRGGSHTGNIIERILQ